MQDTSLFFSILLYFFKIMTFVLFISAVLNTIVLSFVHELVPATEPLPDLIFYWTPYFPEGLRICELIMMTSFSFTLILIVFQRKISYFCNLLNFQTQMACISTASDHRKSPVSYEMCHFARDTASRGR